MSNNYTTPPYWFVKRNQGKGIELKLERNGWRAYYPSGKTELIVGMVNVPEEYWTDNINKKKTESTPLPEVKEEHVAVKDESAVENVITEGQPKKKGRSKKIVTEE